MPYCHIAFAYSANRRLSAGSGTVTWQEAAVFVPVLILRLANTRRNLYSFVSMPNLTPELFAYGFIWYVAFLFSTTCHEASHALAAKIGGDLTAFHGGQVTLNPLPHIRREPYGMVLFPILSFLLNGSMIGWASAPYDLNWERRHPKRAACMALAGPAANFSLMILAVIALRTGFAQGWLYEVPKNFPTAILETFFFLNLLLGTFNLLPVPPLDGSTVILLFMSEERANRYLNWLRGNSYTIVGLIVALLVFNRIFPVVRSFAIRTFF